jgi:predicted nucleic acid-binding protein
MLVVDASALRRAVASGKMSEHRAAAALSDLLDLSVKRYPHAILAPRIWELRDNFSPYDAVYLALAENLTDYGVPLLTSDTRFARAARKHTDVEVLLAA